MSWFKSKIKMVAARASDALAQAADIVAPTLYESRADEFHHRWTTVARFLETIMTRDLDAAEQRRQLLESHTRDSLQKLVLLIYAEENATDRAELTRSVDAPDDGHQRHQQQHHVHGDQAPRACLEYLLERQLIPHLCDVGRRDQPCGIMSLALQFVGALLSRVNHPILPTREVHVSVVALIQAATKREVDDPIVRKCLVTLLNILWKKLRGDPVQTEFFFLHADRGSGGTQLSDLVLFTGLLPHMYAGQKTGEKCREALVIAAGVHEMALCHFILTLTPFCHYAVSGVLSAYDALPKTLPDKLRRGSGSSSGTGAAVLTSEALDAKLQTLASRLRFCSTLVMVGLYELKTTAADGTVACRSISSEILELFRVRFLDGPLLDGLMDTSEATGRTATLYARIILEELASCCRDTNANPLLLMFLQFLVQQSPLATTEQDQSSQEASEPAKTDPELTTAERRLPMELVHRMDSLSSSLSIATMDLFTSLLDLQNDFVDLTLLGSPVSDSVSLRKGSVGALSPHIQMNSAIWFASRFPESAVAANAHIWKIQAFDSMASNVEIPVSSPNESDSSEDQIVSLLSYIADAEYVTCQRAPAVLDDFWDSDEDDDTGRNGSFSNCGAKDGEAHEPSESTKPSRPESENGPLSTSSSSSRTAATRNSMKPLREVALTMALPSYSPVVTNRASTSPLTVSVDSNQSGVFFRLVLNRLERVLESSFYENLALSGLISVLAQKEQCAPVMFDVTEVLGGGGEVGSLRAVLEEVHADAIRRTSRLVNGQARLAEIRRKLVEENNEASLNDHEAETRLLCGYVVVEEILKELCSILFAKERVRSLPVKPEGYYLEPKRLSLTLPRIPSNESLLKDAPGQGDTGPSALLSIGQEFEQLMADAESTMGTILTATSAKNEPIPSAGEGDAIVSALA